MTFSGAKVALLATSMTNLTKFNINFRPSDLEDPTNFDPRFNKYYVSIANYYPGKGASFTPFFYDNKNNTIYTSLFYESFFGKQCNEDAFVEGKFYNVGSNVRNKLKLKVYSYSVPMHEIKVDRIDKESLAKATDSCIIWMSNGFNNGI